VRPDPNDSVARSPAGSTRGSIFSRAKMDRRVKQLSSTAMTPWRLGQHDWDALLRANRGEKTSVRKPRMRKRARPDPSSYHSTGHSRRTAIPPLCDAPQDPPASHQQRGLRHPHSKAQAPRSISDLLPQAGPDPNPAASCRTCATSPCNVSGSRNMGQFSRIDDRHREDDQLVGRLPMFWRAIREVRRPS
jgi:hypothetical protein